MRFHIPLKLHMHHLALARHVGDLRQVSDFASEPGAVPQRPYRQPPCRLKTPDDLLNIPFDEQLAPLHDTDLVAKVGEFGQDVRADDDGFAHSSEFLDQPFDFDAGARIEAGRGFVQKQQFGVVDKTFRQAQSLLHTARQRLHHRLAFLRKIGEFQNAVNDGGTLVFGLPIGGREKVQILPNPNIVIQSERIGHVAEQGTHGERIFHHINAINLNAPGGRRDERRDHFDSCGFARAVRPDKAEDVAAVQGQVRAFDGDERPVDFSQFFEFQQVIRSPLPEVYGRNSTPTPT